MAIIAKYVRFNIPNKTTISIQSLEYFATHQNTMAQKKNKIARHSRKYILY